MLTLLFAAVTAGADAPQSAGEKAIGEILTAFCLCAFAALPSFALMDDEDAIEKARAVLAQMTLEEKVLLMGGSGTMTMPTVPRVGIDREWTFSDNSRTVRPDIERWKWDFTHPGENQSTVLPALSALASTWNPALAKMHGDVLGEEARARGKDQMLGPAVNIMRMPTCGRNWEYMTEDPVLASAMVAPIIGAMQSHDVAATVKHFALNNQELNRYGVDTIVDDRTLNEIYMPAFRAAVKDAKVLSVMTSYNKYNGSWASENVYLQKAVLRDRWGFTGEIVTDWGGQHSCVPAVLAGCGVEMNRGDEIQYLVHPYDGKNPLLDEVRKGKVPESVIDEAVLHLLYVMAKVHYFDPENRAAGSVNTPEHRDIAVKIGNEAITLLKNDSCTLPFDVTRTKRILLVGAMADVQNCRRGWSSEGNPLYEITPAMGIDEFVRTNAEGVVITKAPLTIKDEFVAAHHPVEAVMGTYSQNERGGNSNIKAWEMSVWDNRGFLGEPYLKTYMRKLDFDWAAQEPMQGIRSGPMSMRFHTLLVPLETGLYGVGVRSGSRSGVRITVDGNVIAEDWDGNDSTLVAGNVNLMAGMAADVTVEYRTAPGDAMCHFVWMAPSERGMMLADVKAAAEASDAVIVFTGTQIGHGRALECEGGDRPDLKLPVGHDEAIAGILAWNLPQVAVVVHSGAPLELPWMESCKTLIHLPYLGQECGRSLANVMFGKVNPSGRLPCTWPKGLSDTPVAHKGTYNEEQVIYNEGLYVGYRWYDANKIDPLFPFGFGKSYTTFSWSNFKVSTLQSNKGWKCSLQVRNAGRREGAEVVQVYVSAKAPRVDRPQKELKAFEKVPLAPNGKKQVELVITPRDLAYYDTFSHRFRLDAGEYDIVFAASARDVRSVKAVHVAQDMVFDD